MTHLSHNQISLFFYWLRCYPNEHPPPPGHPSHSNMCFQIGTLHGTMRPTTGPDTRETGLYIPKSVYNVPRVCCVFHARSEVNSFTIYFNIQLIRHIFHAASVNGVKYGAHSQGKVAKYAYRFCRVSLAVTAALCSYICILPVRLSVAQPNGGTSWYFSLFPGYVRIADVP